MSRYLTLDETSKLLRVSEGTVRGLARREGLPMIRVSPRRYLVSEEGLAEWLDGRVVSGAQEASIARRRATGFSTAYLAAMGITVKWRS